MPEKAEQPITLRDQFALAIAPTLLAGAAGLGRMDRADLDRQLALAAAITYRLADALLIERDQAEAEAVPVEKGGAA